MIILKYRKEKLYENTLTINLSNTRPFIYYVYLNSNLIFFIVSEIFVIYVLQIDYKTIT